MNNINSILFVRNGETSDCETLVGHSLITYSYVLHTYSRDARPRLVLRKCTIRVFLLSLANLMILSFFIIQI